MIAYIEAAKEILLLISGTLTLISTALLFFAKWRKSLKLQKIAENLNMISSKIDTGVQEAEKFTNYDGKEKKIYVKSQLRTFAFENKIPYDDQLIDDIIERTVKMSKNVNSKDEADDDEEGSGS